MCVTDPTLVEVLDGSAHEYQLFLLRLRRKHPSPPNSQRTSLGHSGRSRDRSLRAKLSSPSSSRLRNESPRAELRSCLPPPFTGLCVEFSRDGSCDEEVAGKVLMLELEAPTRQTWNNYWHVVLGIAWYFPAIVDKVWFMTDNPRIGIPVILAELSKRQNWRRVIKKLYRHE